MLSRDWGSLESVSVEGDRGVYGVFSLPTGMSAHCVGGWGGERSIGF